MIANATPESNQPDREAAVRPVVAKLSAPLLGGGIALLVVAAVIAWFFGGAQRIETKYASASAPEAMKGIVQLLADHEHKDLSSYEGQPVRELAERAEAAFGDDLPAHWDDYFAETEGNGLQRFFASYLTAFTFAASISLGCLFFVLMQHLTRAGWSVVVRRIAETMAAALLPLGVLGMLIVAPLLFGDHSLYEWNDAELLKTDELLQHKRPYLNPLFFAARSVVYFAVWAALGWFFLSRSRKQDASGSPELTSRMEAAAPLGTLLFAITVNFFAFDFLMSLAPHWFSAVYGIYYFAGAVVAALATMILAAAAMQAAGAGTQIRDDHYHDLAKLLFGFVFFWGYIAFSQYLLIWYANIPEETSWYLARQQEGWEYLGLTLVFGHLIIPFLGLMSRSVRRNKRLLVGWSCWLLLMHLVDLYWNVMPQFSSAVSIQLVDVLTLIGLLLVYVALVFRIAAAHAWSPQRDPRISESLAFHNA